jgi:hypothetical protein
MSVYFFLIVFFSSFVRVPGLENQLLVISSLEGCQIATLVAERVKCWVALKGDAAVPFGWWAFRMCPLSVILVYDSYSMSKAVPYRAGTLI